MCAIFVTKPTRMENKPDIKFGPKIHPLLASLPEHLKDPANYKKIKALVVKSLQGKCSHGEVVEWAACDKCQQRFHNRRDVLKKLGFRYPAQYMLWQQVHEQIRARMPLIDWDKENVARRTEGFKN